MAFLRHPKTHGELKSLFILYEYEKEYSVKIKHRKRRSIPDLLWDTYRWYNFQKSWKHQSKREKQWKQK